MKRKNGRNRATKREYGITKDPVEWNEIAKLLNRRRANFRIAKMPGVKNVTDYKKFPEGN